jgi:large conductance mechanosensitive channel
LVRPGPRRVAAAIPFPHGRNKERTRMLKEFKEFVMKGNLLELAVALILALAFADLVKAFIADIITPIIAAIAGKPDFGGLTFTVNDSVFKYGDFLNFLVTFVLVAFVLFLIVKVANRMMKEKAATTKTCAFCKGDVPIEATRCQLCTSELAAS